MKTFFLTAILIAHLTSRCSALTVELPDIPGPALTMAQVLSIAQQHAPGKLKDFTLVSIDWCKTSDFSPRFGDGTSYSPVNDDVNGFSWFVTYIYKDEQMAVGNRRRFNAVYVMRIKNDGKIGLFIGMRT